jgi:hypothetical protein
MVVVLMCVISQTQNLHPSWRRSSRTCPPRLTDACLAYSAPNSTTSDYLVRCQIYLTDSTRPDYHRPPRWDTTGWGPYKVRLQGERGPRVVAGNKVRLQGERVPRVVAGTERAQVRPFESGCGWTRRRCGAPRSASRCRTGRTGCTPACR